MKAAVALAIITLTTAVTPAAALAEIVQFTVTGVCTFDDTLAMPDYTCQVNGDRSHIVRTPITEPILLHTGAPLASISVDHNTPVRLAWTAPLEMDDGTLIKKHSAIPSE